MDTRRFMLKKIGRVLEGEMKAMCSVQVGSILSSKINDDMKNFTWDKVMMELKKHAPTLTELLLSCTKTRKPRENRVATICMSAALLLKFHLSRMNLVQRIISLILYAGHCGKRVILHVHVVCIQITHTHTHILTLTISLSLIH